MNPKPCVSVIIVTYESRDFIDACLASVSRTCREWIAEYCVVDNASQDGTTERFSARFPGVQLIVNTENIGFGRAVNAAARKCVGEYLLILNPDTIVMPEAVAGLIQFLQYRPQAGACGPKVISPDGRFRNDSRRGFPTPLNAFGYFSGLDRIFPQSRTFGGYHRRWLSPDREVIADCLSGSCLLIRRSLFESAGGFDEDYFLFGEDIDLCWKIKQAGWETWFVPSAVVVHAKGASMRFVPLTARREFYRSMRLFIDKRLTSRYSPIMLSMAKIGIGIAAMISSRYRNSAGGDSEISARRIEKKDS
jgi:O-antigen biosynthesis protein